MNSGRTPTFVKANANALAKHLARNIEYAVSVAVANFCATQSNPNAAYGGEWKKNQCTFVQSEELVGIKRKHGTLQTCAAILA